MAKTEGLREVADNSQLAARMLVMERGEQELREVVRDLARSVARLDETSQQRMDGFAAEVRESLAKLSQSLTDTRVSELTRADERGFRIWGPVLSIGAIIITIFGMLVSAVAFYCNYRFDSNEIDISELQGRAESNTVAILQIGRLQDELKSTREQLNLSRDYGHRLLLQSQGQKDPGPRYFPDAGVAPLNLPDVYDETSTK